MSQKDVVVCNTNCSTRSVCCVWSDN